MKVTIELRRQKSDLTTEPVYIRFNHYNSKLFKGQLRFRFKTNYNLEKGSDIVKKLPTLIRHKLENCIKEVESDFNNRIDFIPSESWFIKTCSEFLNSKKRNGFLLDDMMTAFIDKQIKLGRAENTIKDNKQSQNIINSFRSNIELADCTFALFDEFTEYLKFERDFGVKNLNRKILFLKTILKGAKRKYPTEVPDDFRDLESLRETKAQQNFKIGVYKVTFTKEELKAIDSLELKKDSLINVRKWLTIGVNTALRGQDLLNLTLSDFNIEKKLLQLQQQKTKSIAYIPVLPPVQEVIKDFPRKISLQKFNAYIKEICRLAGMTNIVKSEKKVNTPKGLRNMVVEDEKYTFCASHMFRRSFITKYYRKLSNEEIMKVSGHKSEREFLNYVQEVETNHQIWFDLYNKEK